MSVARPVDGAALRQANAARCAETLRDAERPLTIRQLSARVGLSRPTVEAVLGDLGRRAPIVDDDRAGASGAGRPARRYGFVPSAGCVAGVDAGPHQVRVLVTDLAGTRVAEHEQLTDPGLSGEERLAAVCAAVGAATAGAGPLRAVGVALPGILDHQRILAQSLAIPAWVGMSVGERLATELGCAVVVENDIKLAALAEQRLRSAADGATQVDDLVFLHLGHRVALAVMINGEVIQGSHRIAGELGTLRGMRWTSRSHRGQLQWRTARTAEAVFAAAAAGDDAARQEVAEFCAELAPVVATILLTVDPSLVVIGGGLSRAGALLLDPLTTAVHRLLTVVTAQPPLEGSLLVDDGAACGALGHAFEELSAAVVGVAGVAPPWRRWSPTVIQTAATQPPQEKR